MKTVKTDLAKTGFFSDLFLDYISQKSDLKKYYDLFPQSENFYTKAQNLNFSSERRSVLYQSLLNQYEGFDLSDKMKENLESLKQENTFTITTGHQLNLFSGPLYFIYKIVTVINAAKKLNEENKGLHFVPVYWMATEDHDFEEINHFNLFNKKYTWETEQKGPVGRFSTNGIEKIFPEIKEALPLFEKAYLQHKNLSDATRYFVNELFGKDGLLIIDGDSKELKAQYSSIVHEELLNHIPSDKILKSSQELEQLGYKLQIHPREINLFYIEDNLRERIVKENNLYKVLNTNIQFSEREILEVLKANPEKFSPNVALRPVYQQYILPNICYCGGPAEVAYWLQLKALCDYYKVSFPILLPRIFALFINKPTYNKIEKSGIALEELFFEDHKIKERIIEKVSGIDFKLDPEVKSIESIFESIKAKAKNVDNTLEGYVGAEGQKVIKIIESIEKRIKKAEENKNQTLITQVLNIKSKLFPDGQLQERRDNFLNFYINDASFIDKVAQVSDPLDFRFNIFLDE